MSAAEMLDSALDERTYEAEGDHDLFSHIVEPASAVTEAYITGSTVTALCGKTWVPTKDPERFQVCPTCIEKVNQRRAAER